MSIAITSRRLQVELPSAERNECLRSRARSLMGTRRIDARDLKRYSFPRGQQYIVTCWTRWPSARKKSSSRFRALFIRRLDDTRNYATSGTPFSIKEEHKRHRWRRRRTKKWLLRAPVASRPLTTASASVHATISTTSRSLIYYRSPDNCASRSISGQSLVDQSKLPL